MPVKVTLSSFRISNIKIFLKNSCLSVKLFAEYGENKELAYFPNGKNDIETQISPVPQQLICLK